MSNQHFYQEEGIVFKPYPFNYLCLDVGRNGILRVHDTYVKSPRLLVGCNVSMSYSRAIKRRFIYDDAVYCDTAHLPFRENAFEALLASQVIEHLPCDKGLKMLSDLDLTSKGYHNSKHARWLYASRLEDDEASMIHRLGWRVKNFKARNFIVHGIGCRFYPLVRAKKMALWSPIFYLFTPLSYLIPQLAEIIIAVKRKARTINHE
jgi:hypothetical protein